MTSSETAKDKRAANEYESPARAEQGIEGESLDTRVALHPFFAGMQAAHLKLLTTCAMPAHFRQGQTILREGEFANAFYLIESGTATLESGAGLGEPVLIDKSSRRFDRLVVALPALRLAFHRACGGAGLVALLLRHDPARTL